MQSLSKRARSTTLVILWIISPETKTMKNNVVVLVLKTRLFTVTLNEC